jgi:hypothetical protein
VVNSRRIRWAGHVARMGGMIKAYTVLVEETEGGRPRGAQKNNVKTHLTEIWCDFVTQIGWTRTETGGGPLRTLRWNFGFHERQSGTAERLSA